MADDDKTAGAPKPIASAGSKKKSVASPRPANRSTEWTASDGRGPLEKADDSPEPVRATETISQESAAPASATPDVAAEMRPLSSPHAGFGPKPQSDASVVPSATAPSAATSVAGGTIAPDSSPSKNRLLWPVAAAIILGALSGAGSAYLLYGSANGGTQAASLASRVDALEKRPNPQAAIARLDASVAALSSKVAALPSSAGQAPPASQGAPSAPDLGPLNQKVSALQADLDALKGRGDDTKGLSEKVAALDGALAGMKTATAAAQAGVTSVQDEQKSLAGRVMAPALAVVADSLVQQIDLGQPFGTQVDALAALNADPAKVAILRQNADKGVPSAKALGAKFEPLAEPLEATAQKAPPGAGFMDRLKSGAMSMVSIRRADDTSGNDLPSRVARIQAALVHDDVVAAVATWDALPAAAQAKSAAWGALAKSSAQAMSAARALQHDAIAALATKKS